MWRNEIFLRTQARREKNFLMSTLLVTTIQKPFEVSLRGKSQGVCQCRTNVRERIITID